METCEVCGKQFKNLGVHMRKHTSGNSSSAPTASENEMHPTRKSITFVSPASRELRVVIKPVRQGFITTQGGTSAVMLDGLTVQFRDGSLTTDDPAVIDYLKNVYSDKKFPIIDMTETVAQAKEQI